MSLWVYSVLSVLALSHDTQSRNVVSVNTQANSPSLYKDHNSKHGEGSNVREPSLRFYIRPPRTILMSDTQNEVLECQAGGTPPPRLHWLKNGKRIMQGDEEYLVENSSQDDAESEDNWMMKLGISATHARLYLDCVTPEDSGEYACVAENPYHRTSTHTVVTVLPSTHRVTSGCTSRTSLGKPARIHLWSKKMLEYRNGDATLLCRSDGLPRPHIEWLGIDEKPLPKDTDKYKILPSGDLLIRHLEWSDMGNYVCVASNMHGTARTEGFLYPTTREN